MASKWSSGYTREGCCDCASSPGVTRFLDYNKDTGKHYCTEHMFSRFLSHTTIQAFSLNLLTDPIDLGKNTEPSILLYECPRCKCQAQVYNLKSNKTKYCDTCIMEALNNATDN